MRVLAGNPPLERAGGELCLVAAARDVVHPDWPAPLAKRGAAWGVHRGSPPELAADDASVGQAKVVVRDGAPHAAVIELYAALAWASATDEAHQPLSRRW